MKNILIVDDQINIASLLRDVIYRKIKVNRIDIASSPEEAIEFYNNYKYDIVITDNNLKNTTTGEDLYYILKNIYPSIIICITGMSRSKYPFDDLIIKPDSIINIIETISKYAEKISKEG